MKVNVLDLATGVIAVAAVYLLVRPQSKGAVLVTAFGDLLTALVSTVTGSIKPQGG